LPNGIWLIQFFSKVSNMNECLLCSKHKRHKEMLYDIIMCSFLFSLSTFYVFVLLYSFFNYTIQTLYIYIYIYIIFLTYFSIFSTSTIWKKKIDSSDVVIYIYIGVNKRNQPKNPNLKTKTNKWWVFLINHDFFSIFLIVQ
jgi:hypothetical protein